MKDINLLRGFRIEKKEDLRKLHRLSILVLIAAVAVLVVGFAGLKLAGLYFEKRTEALMAEAVTYSAVSEIKASIGAKHAEIAQIEDALKSTSGTSHVSTAFLWSLSSALNQSTFFTTLTLNENGTLAISGKAATRDDVTYFMYNLKKTGLFSDVSVNMVNTEKQESSGGVSTYSFTINAVLKGEVDGE